MLRLIVGLGNPGSRYEKTRHNAGEWLVRAWAEKEHQTFKTQAKFSGRQAGDASCWFFLPDTYMNESGLAVSAIARFYQIPVDAILIAHDELDLPCGQIRLKTGGGHGGHNGLRSVIHHLGSADFHRLRVGIGHPGRKEWVTEHVLCAPTLDEKIEIDVSIDRALDERDLIAKAEWTQAMNRLHQNR